MIVAALVLAIVVLVVGVWWNDRARTFRALRATPLVTVAAFPEGRPARIEGQVVDGDALEAPLSRRPRVLYQVVIQRRTGGKNQSWREVARELRGGPFVIDDGTGRAVVDPASARVALVQDHRSRSGAFDDATAAEEALLRRHGLRSTGLLFNKVLRYHEAVIAIGESVAVAGVGVREPDPGQPPGEGYREGPPVRVRLGGTRAHPLLLTDEPLPRER